MSSPVESIPAVRVATEADIPVLARMACDSRDHNRKEVPAPMSPAQVTTIASYDACAEAYDHRIGALANYDETYDAMLACLAPGARILDLACGPATVSRYLAARSQVSVTCVDLSERMLHLAGRHLPGATLVRGSIIDVSLPGQFDLVINGFGLPYLDEDQCGRCIASSAAMLAPAGWMYVSFMKGDRASVERTSFGGDHLFAMHYHTETRMRSQLVAAGLRVERSWALDYTEPDGSISTDIILLAQKPS